MICSPYPTISHSINNLTLNFQSLEDVIRLSVKIKVDGGEKTKSYSYSDLKDLQSKLTLVAGDKQKENRETIRRFDTVCSITSRSYT